MASNTNIQPTHSDENNPLELGIIIDVICIPDGREIVEGHQIDRINVEVTSDEEGDSADFMEGFMLQNSAMDYVQSLTSFIHLLDDLSEELSDRHLEAAIQESLESYECLERKSERRVDVETRIATDDEKTNMCAICQQAIVKGDKIGTPACKHDFHFQCLTEWGHYKAECPICKDVIQTECDK